MRALEVFGPVSYAGYWLPLAVAALVLAVAGPLAIWWLTRPAPPPPLPPPPPPPNPELARREALAEIAQIRTALADGSLGPKPASQRLSRVVRTFLAGRGRADLDSMTLYELRQDPRLAPVADFVAGVYQPAFGPVAEGEAAQLLDRSAQEAERLVVTWA